jgi:hypothetical protein
MQNKLINLKKHTHTHIHMQSSSSRVQQLINIKIAKPYLTTSNEALCILTGTTLIGIKVEETVKLCRITRDRQNHQLDHDAEPKDWTHLADSVRINERIEGKEQKSAVMLMKKAK